MLFDRLRLSITPTQAYHIIIMHAMERYHAHAQTQCRQALSGHKFHLRQQQYRYNTATMGMQCVQGMSSREL